MRGRTNVLSGGGEVIVNGQVKEFEVASGNTISVGDFVSFTRNVDEPTTVMQSGNFSSIIIYKEDDFYIQKILYENSGVVQLVKNGEVKKSLTIDNNYEAVYLSTLSKLVIGDSATYSVYSVDKSLFSISLLKTTTSSLDNFNRWQVFELGDKFLTLKYRSNVVATIFSLSSDNVVSVFKTVNISNSYYFWENGKGVGFYKNGKLSIFHWYSKLVLSYFNFDGDNLTIDGYNVLKPSIANQFYDCFVNYFNNNILLTFPLAIAGRLTDDSRNVTNYVIANYDETSDKIVSQTIFNLEGYEGAAASTNYPYISNGYQTFLIPLGDNKFLCFATAILKNNSDFGSSTAETNSNYSIIYYCIYEYQNSLMTKVTNWIELYRANKPNFSNSYWLIKCFLVNFMYYYLVENVYYCYFGLTSGNYNANYDVYDLLLINFQLNNDVIGDVTGKVVSYNGNSLGFAKTGGTAGETIKVYVPHENN